MNVCDIPKTLKFIQSRPQFNDSLILKFLRYINTSITVKCIVYYHLSKDNMIMGFLQSVNSVFV